MKRLTNHTNIPLSVAAWLASDNYNFKPNEKAISATDLGKSVRQLVLRNRLRAAGGEVIEEMDIAERFSSRLGTAIHDAIEAVWVNQDARNSALTQLGIPKQVRDRLVYNPSPEEIAANPKCIPVFMEQRTNKELNGYTISGQFDFLAEGQLEDFKSTGSYSVEKQLNEAKFALQGSIYRWLNPDKITKETTRINYIIKDWSAAKAKASPKYPKSCITTVNLPLMSYEDTEKYIANKLSSIDKHKTTPEPELPLCTAEELWQDSDTYKYFTRPDSTRASKVFGNDSVAAYKHLADKGGKGLIRTFPGEVRACKYCDAKDICTQRKELQESGLFKP